MGCAFITILQRQNMPAWNGRVPGNKNFKTLKSACRLIIILGPKMCFAGRLHVNKHNN
jgi:hypothetical protein